MNRRKLALLIALSVLLIVLAAVTATTAWEVLGAGYEVAGDGKRYKSKGIAFSATWRPDCDIYSSF